MDQIPTRENLESMSRAEIQTLCKENNVKANMRTREMINALCDLVNEKDVPLPHRYASERMGSEAAPNSRVNSLQPASNTTEITKRKIALPQSEPDTNTESVADFSASAPITRRKARELQQIHLANGQPIIAASSETRDTIKVSSRGARHKSKATTMLKDAPIPEEDEAGSAQVPTDQAIEHFNMEKVATPSSARLLSPIANGPTNSHNNSEPSRLATPTPSHPSYSWLTAQLKALECRIAAFETSNVAERLSDVESALTDIPVLKESVGQLQTLQLEIKRLEVSQRTLETEKAVLAKSNSELTMRTSRLEDHLKDLVAENEILRERITELDMKFHSLQASARDASISSVTRSSKANSADDTGEEDADIGNGAEAAVGTVTTVAVTGTKPIVVGNEPDPRYPSPSQPILGKRLRSPTESPDVSLGDILAGVMQKQREDAELPATDRIIKSPRKKARLALDPGVATAPRAFFQHGPRGCSSTSTLARRRSGPPRGFFIKPYPAGTSLGRADVNEEFTMHADINGAAVRGIDTLEFNSVVGPSNTQAANPAETALRSPPLNPVSAGPSTHLQTPRAAVASVYDPAFFDNPSPVRDEQSPQLPFPLRSITPKPATPNNVHSLASQAIPQESPSNSRLCTNGRKERYNNFKPYFTPSRAPGARHRTTRRFSAASGSPVQMEPVVESLEEEPDDDGERSSPTLGTLWHRAPWG